MIQGCSPSGITVPAQCIGQIQSFRGSDSLGQALSRQGMRITCMAGVERKTMAAWVLGRQPSRKNVRMLAANSTGCRSRLAVARLLLLPEKVMVLTVDGWVGELRGKREGGRGGLNHWETNGQAEQTASASGRRCLCYCGLLVLLVQIAGALILAMSHT